MTAHVVITNGVTLVRCTPCGIERVAPSPRAAERLAREHNNTKHKEG